MIRKAFLMEVKPGKIDEYAPVMTKADWPGLTKKLARFDPWSTDPRMRGALEVIKNGSREVGDDTPLVATYNVGASSAMCLFRPNEAFMEDMIEDPEWVDEMCRVATEFSLNFIRAQYEAGANSATFIGEVIGTLPREFDVQPKCLKVILPR